MSSDDYLYVGRKSNGKFTILHLMGDGPDSKEAMQASLDMSTIEYDTFPEAVLRAHQEDLKVEFPMYPSEYGVRVDGQELERFITENFSA